MCFFSYLALQSSFLEIDQIPIKSYFLTRKDGYKWGNIRKKFGQILGQDWSAPDGSKTCYYGQHDDVHKISYLIYMDTILNL